MNIFGAGMYIKQLADKINEIIVNEVSFGNKLLYAMCVDKEGQEWGNASRLADKLWLIGRAYTASPERRFTKKEKSSNDYHGDGTGLFFEEVASNIIRAESYKNIVSAVRGLQYLQFDGTEKDFTQLRNGILCVIEFNALLKIALQQFDESYGAKHKSSEYKNHISFCSKFLHFHAPDNISIFDSFTEEGAKTLVEFRRQKPLTLEGVVIDKTVVKLFSVIYEKIQNYKPIYELVTNIKDDKERDWAERYSSHCMREYAIGCFIKEKIENSPKVSMLRLVDSVCQRVKKTDKNRGTEK